MTLATQEDWALFLIVLLELLKFSALEWLLFDDGQDQIQESFKTQTKSLVPDWAPGTPLHVGIITVAWCESNGVPGNFQWTS